MSKGAKRETADLRLFLIFTRELSIADSIDQVYGAALRSVQELFKPDRAFVALSDRGDSAAEPQPIHPGWVSDLAVPIHAGDELLGKFVLQFDEIRSFSEHDAALMETLAAQAGIG